MRKISVFIKSLLLIFLFSISLNAGFRDGEYVLPAQTKKPDRVPIQRTDVITGIYSDTLEEIDSIPALKPGQLILRRKTGNTYQFYKGKLDTTAFKRKPQLYVFDVPGWSELRDITRYRFYRLPTEKHGTDEDDVYFDNERIYLQHFSKIYYYRNHTWFSLDGKTGINKGGIVINTEPSGAKVIINGDATKYVTPCRITDLIPDVYTFELLLDGYHIFRKSVKIYPGTFVNAAFELLSDMDTVYITGNAPYGVLILPQPPTDTLFEIDSVKMYDLKTRLYSGKHRIRWNGGSRYQSVDTTIFIDENRVTYFDYLFKRRYGVLRVVPSPADAEVCIQGQNCRLGEQVLELSSGVYRVSSFRNGFRNLKTDVTVVPDSLTVVEMNLLQEPDRDADGFVDSLDNCPDVYGLHDGCPKMKVGDALKVKAQELHEFVKNDPLNIGFPVVGVITKMPTRKHFANFLSTFSSGRIGGINNYRGLAILNGLHAQFRSLFGDIELGQWAAGMHYQRFDTLKLVTENTTYQIFYDSIYGIEPVIFIPSTAVSIGVHYQWSWLNLVYSVGHQWEDIIIDQLYNASTGEFERITFDNDWWFHQLLLEANFNVGEFLMPAAYLKLKIPFGRSRYTRWHSLQVGLKMNFVPSQLKD